MPSPHKVKKNPFKWVDQFTYLGSNVSSTESDDNIGIDKVWNAIDRLTTLWKSDFSNKTKTGILLSCCHDHNLVWLHHLDFNKTHEEKNPYVNYIRSLCAVLNEPSKQHPTKNIANHSSKMNKTRWWSKDELSINVLLWIHSYGHISVDWPKKAHNQLLFPDTWCCQEDFSWTMAERNE